MSTGLFCPCIVVQNSQSVDCTEIHSLNRRCKQSKMYMYSSMYIVEFRAHIHTIYLLSFSPSFHQIFPMPACDFETKQKKFGMAAEVRKLWSDATCVA
jgi:hypothetical protein